MGAGGVVERESDRRGPGAGIGKSQMNSMALNHYSGANFLTSLEAGSYILRALSVGCAEREDASAPGSTREAHEKGTG
jgi:hypothetical protein